MKALLLTTTLAVLLFSCCCKVENCIRYDDEDLVHYSERPERMIRNSEKAKRKLRKANGDGEGSVGVGML